MARLLAYLLLVVLGFSLLHSIPGLGRLLGGFWGLWLVVIVLGLAGSRLASGLTRVRRLSGELRQLAEVDSPHNRGKLGSLLLANGRAGRAVGHLEAAARGEPDVAEWHYRLGMALLATGRAGEARTALDAAAGLEPEHAYGGIQLALAQARLQCGDAAGSLEALATFERDHGSSPESCYRRGQALRSLGRREEARDCFRRVAPLAWGAARFQRAANRPWVWRSFLQRLM